MVSQSSFLFFVPILLQRTWGAPTVSFFNQAIRAHFVQNYDGCKKIGDKIIDGFKLHERIIVDGIRQLDTFNYIKENLPSTKLIYIDLPIDSSFSFYKRRSKREITIHEFREVRNHPVERDITFLKNRADLYIYNGSTFEDLINEMNSWLNETV